VSTHRQQAPHTPHPDRWFRLFVVAVVIFAVATTVGGIALVDAFNRLDQTQKDAAATARTNHENRLTDQERTDLAIRQLACLLISHSPNNPKVPAIAEFRKAYGCAPYSKASAADPFAHLPGASSPPAPALPPPSTQSSTPSPRSTPSLSPPGALPEPSTRTRTQTQTQTVTVTRTKTVTVRPKPSKSKKPAPLPTQACLPIIGCIPV
jgi:hypothetical protein